MGKNALSFCIHGLNSHLCSHLKELSHVLRVPRRKSSEIPPSRWFLSYVVDEMFIKIHLFYGTSPALWNSWLQTCLSFHSWQINWLLSKAYFAFIPDRFCGHYILCTIKTNGKECKVNGKEVSCYEVEFVISIV